MLTVLYSNIICNVCVLKTPVRAGDGGWGGDCGSGREENLCNFAITNVMIGFGYPADDETL